MPFPNNLDSDFDPELDKIETDREIEAIKSEFYDNYFFETLEATHKNLVVHLINKLSLNIKSSKGQSNEQLLKRAELYLTNEHLDNTYTQNAYEDLKAIIDHIQANPRPSHQQIRTRVYALVENKNKLYQNLLAYEEKLGDHQASKRARISSSPR